MKFLNQLKVTAQQMLRGRYGSDQLNVFFLIVAIMSSILSGIFESWLLSTLSLIPLIICYIRIFSKNIHKRYSENQRFLSFYTPLKQRVLKYMTRLKHLKTHKYLHCSQCKQSLRVPRGKGKICVTCPKCKTMMHIKS